jgi:microcystin degradation protein MlrC
LRIGILSLLQESNTFISGTTTLQHFEDDLLLVGEAMGPALTGAHPEAGGLAGLEQQGLTPVPLFAARALPYGTMDAAILFQH